MPPPDPDLTPAQERAVRARLADARHEGPVPDDVAARLDATLAGLVADRDGPSAAAATGPTGRVVELRSRRRKAVAGLLAAAAFVVVGGVVSGQILGDQVTLPTVGGSAESAGGSDSAAEESAGGDAAPAERDAQDRDRAGADGVEDPTLAEQYGAPSGAREELAGLPGPVVDPDAFAADAARLRGLGRVSAMTRDGATTSTKGGCSVAAGRGRRVLVTYEGQPALLVYRRPVDGRQLVELHLCGSLAPRRTTEIPAD